MDPIPNNSDLETQINNAIENNLSGRMTILAALLAVQDDIGYIPQKALEIVTQDESNDTISNINKRIID